MKFVIAIEPGTDSTAVAMVDNARAGDLAGAIIGGAIGSQFGSGNGRLAATAAGSVIGSNVADQADEHPRRPNVRRARGPVSYREESPAYYAPQQRYYSPAPQYLSSEPGGPIVIQGGGYGGY